jgi:diguanylate cyclase (GGDEF)-like protein/PAS domain S-box-containing protein
VPVRPGSLARPAAILAVAVAALLRWRRLRGRLEREISSRRRAEGELRESEERFRQLLELSGDALFVHDDRGRIYDCNSEAYRSLGYSREELLSMRIGDFVSDMIPEDERTAKKGGTLWQRAISGEPGRIVGVHVGEFRRKDGTTFPVEVSVGSIVYGGRRRILGSARDVSERRRVEERLLHQQAFHDPLTGLPNRALFLDRLERALARAARARYAVALLFLDLDGFKAVNDDFGHEAGDRLLVAVAGRLSMRLRSEDTVARFGGDEFTVLLQNVGGPSEATEVAHRILEDLREPFLLEGREHHVTASIGIALSTPAEEDPTPILRRADEAMYLAKQRGRARYALHEG